MGLIPTPQRDATACCAPLAGFRRIRRTRAVLPSALRWQNDTEYDALVWTHLSWSADVSATIGRDDVVDLVVGNRRPRTVHFNFVVVANHATLGRPTIH
jgi:hypothetical protein